MELAKDEPIPSAATVAGAESPRYRRLRLMATQAVVITLVVGAMTYFVLGRPPLLGIDDANITQVYAANLAAGHGYVYQVGGERVEGSTSFAWTLINAVVFASSKHPEALIAGIGLGLCAVAVFFSLLLAETLASQFRVSNVVTNWVTALAIAATPALFAWEIWTLMDLVLWSALLVIFLSLLTTEVACARPQRQRSLALSSCALALVLTRPEGVALALFMLLGAALLSWLRERPPLARYRPYLMASAAGLGCFALLTAGRALYFGYPFPNTFYAKVSSSPLRQLSGGIHYLVGYVSKSPYCVVYLAAWGGLLSVCASNRSAVSSAARASAALGLATIVAVLGLYVALGGDHFPLYRFYEPLSLLLPLAFALACAYAWPRVPGHVQRHVATKVALAGAATLFVLGAVGELVGSADGLRLQCDTGMDGRKIAERLQRLPTLPSVGVVAAGGFAREYAGKTYDLMGLNWVAMAHADPVKTGRIRNHAGFSPRVFWKTRPEVLAFTGNRCADNKAWAPDTFETNALKGIQSTPEFRAEYTPAKVDCYFVFARKDLLARLGPQDVITPIQP